MRKGFTFGRPGVRVARGPAAAPGQVVFTPALLADGGGGSGSGDVKLSIGMRCRPAGLSAEAAGSWERGRDGAL